MDSEKAKFQMEGLKFLYEMELVGDPQLINNLKLNVFSISNSIREVELLSSYHHRSILVFIDVSWFGKIFSQNRIVTGVHERVSELLPNFRFRVITNRAIFDLALKQVSAVLKGDPHEVFDDNSGYVTGKSSSSKA